MSSALHLSSGHSPDEEHLQLALKAVLASGLKPNGQPKLGLQKAALTYNVPSTTLTAWYKGHKTWVESHSHQQRLTPSQELVLKEWVKSLGLWGVLLSLSSVAEYASVIINGPISTRWVYAFRKWHPDLVVRWTTGLEFCCAQVLNKTQVTGFFNILHDLLTHLVFAGPVQSGFLPQKWATVDRNRSRTNPDIEGTEPNHLGPVFCGPWCRFRPV